MPWSLVSALLLFSDHMGVDDDFTAPERAVTRDKASIKYPDQIWSAVIFALHKRSETHAK
jgi:hypothetical protein